MMTEQNTNPRIDKTKPYKRHPASAAQPDLTDDEKAALRRSIQDHGQRVPILATRDDEIIDGWHRLNACWETFKDPIVETISDEDHKPERLASLVSGLIRGRRHLSKKALAEIDINIKRACGIEWPDPWRPNKKGSQNGELNSDLPERTENGEKPEPHPLSDSGIAADAGVSKRTAARAKQNRKSEESGTPPATPKPKPLGQRAKESGQRASRKEVAKQAANDEISILREIAEGLQEELDELKAELLSLRTTTGDVDHGDALAEAQGTIKASRQQNEDLRKRIKIERNRRQTAEQNAAYWEAYARRLDEGLGSES